MDKNTEQHHEEFVRRFPNAAKFLQPGNTIMVRATDEATDQESELFTLEVERIRYRDKPRPPIVNLVAVREDPDTIRKVEQILTSCLKANDCHLDVYSTGTLGALVSERSHGVPMRLVTLDDPDDAFTPRRRESGELVIHVAVEPV